MSLNHGAGYWMDNLKKKNLLMTLARAMDWKMVQFLQPEMKPPLFD